MLYIECTIKFAIFQELSFSMLLDKQRTLLFLRYNYSSVITLTMILLPYNA